MGHSGGDVRHHGRGGGSGGGHSGVLEEYITLSLSKRCTATTLQRGVYVFYMSAWIFVCLSSHICVNE